MTRQIVGPFRHYDIFPLPTTHDCSCEPPARKRPISDASVARIASQQVARAAAPVVAKLQAMHAQLDALKAKQDRIRAHHDAIREAERHRPPPAGYVRDASGEIRPRTTRDLAVAANAAYGRDANGKRPGEPGYQFDGVAMVKAGASWNDINAAFWGRKA